MSARRGTPRAGTCAFARSAAARRRSARARQKPKEALRRCSLPLFCASASLTANAISTSALRGEIEITSMQRLDLSARRLRRAAVVDDIVRGLEPRRAVYLSAQHLQRLGTRDRVAPHQTLELRGLRSIDDENSIDELSEARFDEQRHGHERVWRLELRELRARAAANQRMEYRFELSPFGVIGEHE